MSDELGKKIEETSSAIQRVRKKLDIKTETISDNREVHQHHRELIKRAGSTLTPIGSRYVGTAVVHVYEPFSDAGGMLCVTNATFTKEITEVQAGLAMDELRRKLMAAYGRTPHGR